MNDSYTGTTTPSNADTTQVLLKKIAASVDIAKGSGAPDTQVEVGVTPQFHSMGASQSFTIPAGANGWAFTLLTGTGTFGGVAVAATFNESDPNTLAAGIPVTTGATSSAYVRYNQ